MDLVETHHVENLTTLACSNTILPTTVIKIRAGDGWKVPVLCLIDQGSPSSYIAEDLTHGRRRRLTVCGGRHFGRKGQLWVEELEDTEWRIIIGQHLEADRTFEKGLSVRKHYWMSTHNPFLENGVEIPRAGGRLDRTFLQFTWSSQ